MALGGDKDSTCIRVLAEKLVMRAPAVNPAKTFLWIVYTKTAEHFRGKSAVRCRIGKRASISYSLIESLCKCSPRITLYIAEDVDHRPHGEAFDTIVSKAV